MHRERFEYTTTEPKWLLLGRKSLGICEEGGVWRDLSFIFFELFSPKKCSKVFIEYLNIEMGKIEKDSQCKCFH